MSEKNKVVTLNLEARLNVIEDASNGLSQRKLAEKYKCGKTQIQKILKEKVAIRERWMKNANKNQKRETRQRYKEVNELTLVWFESARARKIPISGPILQEKAVSFARGLKIEKFTASSGWLEKFCRRNNIVLKTLRGESESVNKDNVAEWLEQLLSIIKNYDFKDVFNVDETCLFYRALPTKSLLFTVSDTFGSKKTEPRITVMFCVNFLGEKEPPLIINDILRPRCFKNVDMSMLKVDWYANKKALMTGAIFTEWLEAFNEKMKKEKRKVLLLLDNAPCHPKSVDLSNVVLLFLPANSSSTSQPLLQDVIHAFKLHYRRQILTTLLACMDSGENIEEVIKKITIADVVEYVKDAWNSLSETTIRKCFKKCGINCVDRDDDVQDLSVEGDVIELGRRAYLDIDTEFDEDEEIQNSDNWENEILESCYHYSSRDDENRAEGEEESHSKGDEENRSEGDEEIMPLSESFNAVRGLKQLSRSFGNYRMVELITEFQNILEKEVLNQKTKSN